MRLPGEGSSKKLIERYAEGDTREPEVRARIGVLEGVLSIIVNTILFLVKLVMGLVIGSVALIADGIHSLSDSLSSMVVIIGAKMSAKPADAEHPFGHGRIEYVAAILIAFFLVITGFEFLKTAFDRILEPVEFDLSIVAVVAVTITIVVKLWLGGVSQHMGKVIDSSIVEADAMHHLTDAVSSVLVVMALILTPMGFPWVDGVMGILVACFIFYAGWELARGSIDDLIGRPVPDETLSRLRAVVLSHPDVEGVHDVMVHDYGSTKIAAIHAEHDVSIGIYRSHDICHEIEDLVHEELGMPAIIHADPIDLKDPETIKLREYLRTIVDSHEEFDDVHDCRIVGGEQIKKIVCDLKLTPQLPTSEREAQRSRFIGILKEEYPEHEISVYLEPLFNM